MGISRRKFSAVGVMAATAALLLSACAGSASNNASTPAASGGSGSAASCGSTPITIAKNAWTGYYANVAVVDYILRTNLGCTTKISEINEQVAWQGFPTGQVDLILENWGHDDLVKKYITDQKVAVDLGPTGNQGIIGWYVPAWMAEKYPDITDYKNLNKYADLFKTSESGDKGQLLDGDPSYVTNDVALVKNLGLNYKVVTGGSEAALITAMQKATDNKSPLLFYFYEPQYALANIKVARVALPPYTAGCDADPAKVACDYPPYTLNKIARAKWVEAGGPAVDFLKKFNWTNDDQNQVAADIAAGKSYDEAAKNWIDKNQDKVKAWLQS
ncbi:MAG: ABC transporter substrate-binding protein [Candidatus Nanopelagicales bacterium]